MTPWAGQCGLNVDRFHADVDRDGTVVNVEWGFFLVGVAAPGLPPGFRDGPWPPPRAGCKRCSGRGSQNAKRSWTTAKLCSNGGGRSPTAQASSAEFESALAGCVPRVFVSPPRPRSRSGKTQSFSARSNEGDTDSAGRRATGPSTPRGCSPRRANPALSRSRPPFAASCKGSATVTVDLPGRAGRVRRGVPDHLGECRAGGSAGRPRRSPSSSRRPSRTPPTRRSNGPQAVAASAKAACSPRPSNPAP